MAEQPVGAGGPEVPPLRRRAGGLSLIVMVLLALETAAALAYGLIGGEGGRWWIANEVVLVLVLLLVPTLLWFVLLPLLVPRAQRGLAWVLGLLLAAWMLGLVPRTESFRGRAYRGRWLQGASLEFARSMLGESVLRHELWYDLGPSPPSPLGVSGRAMLQVRCGEDEAVLSAQAWHHDGGALRPLAGEPVAFDGDAWREAAPEQRQAMVHDLLASGRLEDLDRAGVLALLGPAKASPSYLRGVGTDRWDEYAPRFPVDDEGRIDHFR